MPDTPLHQAIDDAERLLGVLAIELVTTDDGNQTALALAMQRLLDDQGWERQARGWEVLAAAAIHALVKVELTELLGYPDRGDAVGPGTLEPEMAFDWVRAGTIERGRSYLHAERMAVDRAADFHFSDPVDLTYTMYLVAACAAQSAAAAAALALELEDYVGDGDREPRGGVRLALDWIADALADLRTAL